MLVRMVQPGDRDLLKSGFTQLSARSRQLRFLGAKDELTDEELSDLVTLDGVDRLALGARRLGPDGTEGEGLGIARFARRADRPTMAEAAVTVLDEVQGQGLGALLLARLAAAARERGIERFSCEFDAANERIWHLLERVAPVTEVVDHGFVRAEVVLPATPTRSRPRAGRARAAGTAPRGKAK